jgi:hypothetical protein
LMKSELTLPIRMGYNFDNGLFLARKSYVAWRIRSKNQNQLWKCSLLRLRGCRSWPKIVGTSFVYYLAVKMKTVLNRPWGLRLKSSSGALDRPSPVSLRRPSAARRRVPPSQRARRRQMACMRPRPPDPRSTSQIRSGRTPSIGPPWTRGPGPPPGPRPRPPPDPRSTVRDAPSAGQPRAPPAVLQKAPEFLLITKMPFHLYNFF